MLCLSIEPLMLSGSMLKLLIIQLIAYSHIINYNNDVAIATHCSRCSPTISCSYMCTYIIQQPGHLVSKVGTDKTQPKQFFSLHNQLSTIMSIYSNRTVNILLK